MPLEMNRRDKRFLNLIRRAIHALKDSWNVVVTVRTYDAMKSQELLDLFGILMTPNTKAEIFYADI